MQEIHLDVAYGFETSETKVIDLDDGRRLRIGLYQDDDPGSPREWDNMGTMVCWSRKYTLGDEQPGGEPSEWRRDLAESLDPTFADRAWHWENGNGWARLAREADAEAARLRSVAKSREEEAAALREAANTLRDRVSDLLMQTGESTFTIDEQYDLTPRDLAALAGDAAEATAEATVLAERAADITRVLREMQVEATQARIDAQEQGMRAVDAADERIEALIDQVLDEQIAVILPLYLYEHGGITMRAHPFSCQWDSGQVGWIYVTKADAKREYSLTRLSPKARKLAEGVLQGEVETYAQYLEGQVYGYTWEVEEAEVCECCADKEWRVVAEASVWGFYGWPGEYMIPDEINPAIEKYGVQVSN